MVKWPDAVTLLDRVYVVTVKSVNELGQQKVMLTTSSHIHIDSVCRAAHLVPV